MAWFCTKLGNDLNQCFAAFACLSPHPSPRHRPSLLLLNVIGAQPSLPASSDIRKRRCACRLHFAAIGPCLPATSYTDRTCETTSSLQDDTVVALFRWLSRSYGARHNGPFIPAPPVFTMLSFILQIKANHFTQLPHPPRRSRRTILRRNLSTLALSPPAVFESPISIPAAHRAADPRYT
ncbi:hypothetical protein B0H13DRAFT_2367483 [Mycena leptocephala]|nr:hypothetical protein B0H13DRAFT_2367483 [Mycena leptocephala]